MYWMTFSWPWPKVTAVASISINLIVCAIKRALLIGSLQNVAALLPKSWLLPDYILKQFWYKLLLWQISLKVKHYFGHISGMIGPIGVKRKRSASVWYWVWYVTLTIDLTLDLGLGCFRVKFRNSCISGIAGLIDVKWKGSELIWCWADCTTLPLDHTHDLDLGVPRSESEIAISGMGRPIDMKRKGCESSIHDHDIDQCDHGGVGGCTG